MRAQHDLTMPNFAKSLPDAPEGLRAFTAPLLVGVASQSLLITRLRHRPAGRRNHRFGASFKAIEQVQLAFEASEIAIAKLTAKLWVADDEPDAEKNKPKRRPIPDHIPWVKIELTIDDDDCAQCGGALRRLGEGEGEDRDADRTEPSRAGPSRAEPSRAEPGRAEPLEYVPGARPSSLDQWRTRSRPRGPHHAAPRIACTGCKALTQAPLPSHPIERGRPGPSPLAHVLARCLIPDFDGAISSSEWKDALWARYCTQAPRRRGSSCEPSR
jgi:hypothetical protein